MNAWIIRKNSIKHYYLKKKKDFYNHLNMGDNTDSDDADTNRTRIKRFQE